MDYEQVQEILDYYDIESIDELGHALFEYYYISDVMNLNISDIEIMSCFYNDVYVDMSLDTEDIEEMQSFYDEYYDIDFYDEEGNLISGYYVPSHKANEKLDISSVDSNTSSKETETNMSVVLVKTYEYIKNVPLLYLSFILLLCVASTLLFYYIFVLLENIKYFFKQKFRSKKNKDVNDNETT